jgi:hypothetical protein
MFKGQSRFSTPSATVARAELDRIVAEALRIADEAAAAKAAQAEADAAAWALQRYGGAAATARVTSAANGAVTWTFPREFELLPTVNATVQDAAGSVVHAIRITALSKTQVSLQVDRYTHATLLGVVVLALASPAAVTVHIIAKESNA